MKTTVFCAAIAAAVTALAITGLGQQGQVLAQRNSDVEGTELITVSAMIGEKGYQQLTVIDPRSRVMSVYHLELATGAITLKSVRNIHWDLQLSQFNGVSPLPHEIRAILEPK